MEAIGSPAALRSTALVGAEPLVRKQVAYASTKAVKAIDRTSSRTVGFCVGHGSVPRPVAERDFVLWPALHRGAIGLQRDEIVADGGNLLDQVLPGRIVPAVNGVGVVGHAGHLARLDNGQGRAERNRYFL